MQWRSERGFTNEILKVNRVLALKNALVSSKGFLLLKKCIFQINVFYIKISFEEALRILIPISVQICALRCNLD